MWHLPDSSLCHPQSWLHPTLICHMIVKQPSLATRSMGILIHALSDAAAAKSLQSCLTLSDPMDCSLPGSSIHGIFWATVLEWGAIVYFSCSHWVRVLSFSLTGPIYVTCLLLGPGGNSHPEWLQSSFLKVVKHQKDFPGGPVVKTLCS